MNKQRKAKKNTSGVGMIIGIWIAHHVRSFLASLGQLSKNPVGNLFSIAVIGTSLALPTGFYIMLDNARRVMESWESMVQVTLFLHSEVTDDQTSALIEKLSDHEMIDTIHLITKDQALQEFKQLSGFAEAFDALEENPLPSLLLIQPRTDALSSQQGDILINYLNDLTEVESAQLDRQWVNRLLAILRILQRFIIILASVLSIAVLLIIGNTIRLSIINKRTEIEINKLFGATNSFIQRPFLYTGLIYGVIGSIFAWLLLLASKTIMDGPINQLAALYNSNFSLSGLGLHEIAILIVSGGGLGLLGSWLAVQRHLYEVEST